MTDSYTNKNTDTFVSNNLSKFYGFYSSPYKDPATSGHAFIFMTKPSLFIEPIAPKTSAAVKRLAYINMTRDPYFNQFLADQALNKNDIVIAESLAYDPSTLYFESNFLPSITNECKGFEANDVTMESSEVFDTKQGFRQPLPTHKSASEGSGSFSIEVTEDSNLSFTKMMGIWVNYISNITDGTFDANPNAVLNGELDYMSSLYYFVLEPDGRTLRYWAKYTGCWPTVIPYSAQRYSKGSQEPIELTLQFNYTIKEDMNPRILEDFNTVSLKLSDYANGRIPSTSVQGYYASIKESPLLNRTNMLQSLPEVVNTLSSESRDPLVFYKDSSNSGLNSDESKAHFELLFDDFGYSSDFINDVFSESGNSYYINDSATNDFVKTGSTETWDTSGFWDEE